jgi:FtsP/CotA-like multicopper oxidase with cupredoxin domain
MSFTDQKPFLVTTEDTKKRWGTNGEAFGCALCGHMFQEGDTARWVYTNGATRPAHVLTKLSIAGNPFVCNKCDGPQEEVLAKLWALLAEFSQPKFWWLRKKMKTIGHCEGYNEASRER